MNSDEIKDNPSSESNDKHPSYIEIVRSIIGGASLGAIIGTPLGFFGSAVGAGIGGVLIPFFVLKDESDIDNQNSTYQSDES